jgi:DNA-binding PadR family transcriptional regulator
MTSRLPADKEIAVLQVLREGPREMYGLEIVKASGGQLGRAAIYITLARMLEKGYIQSRTPAQDSHPGLPRPRYKLTAVGERALKAAEKVREIMEPGLVRMAL